jgi:cyclic pyranopterin phosphate synthase
MRAEIGELVAWAHGQHEITLIGSCRWARWRGIATIYHLPLTQVRRDLEQRFTLEADGHRSGGPARYWRVAETGGRLGLITPLTSNFGDGCNCGA